MSNYGEMVMYTILSGSFPNQADAFRALQKEASEFGIDVGPEDTDVVRESREVRLALYFRPAIVARLEEASAPDDTIIVLFPSELTALPRFPTGDGALRLLGRFAGIQPERL